MGWTHSCNLVLDDTGKGTGGYLTGGTSVLCRDGATVIGACSTQTDAASHVWTPRTVELADREAIRSGAEAARESDQSQLWDKTEGNDEENRRERDRTEEKV